MYHCVVGAPTVCSQCKIQNKSIQGAQKQFYMNKSQIISIPGIKAGTGAQMIY